MRNRTFNLKTGRHLGKGLSSSLPCHSKRTWDRATLGPPSLIFSCATCYSLSAMKKISSYFNTPQSSRKRPSEAHNPQPESHSSTDDKTPHEEKKKCRIFQPSWKQTYPWLKFMEGKMFCGTCLDSNNSAERLANPTSAFVTGTENFRLDSIKSHESSIPHVQATKASVFRLNPQQAPLPRALAAVSEEVQMKMEKLFDIAYFVAKLELPFTVFENIASLEAKHGVKLGQTYHNDKACKNFIRAIAEQFNCDLSQTLTSARFISIMADGATDVGTREVLDVYVRLLENGKAVNTFVALKECPNGKAQGITEAITLAMDEKDQNWKNKTACLGTDGASVMVGQHGGVFGILKRDIPSLISVHCIAHNLELGLQDTLKAIPLFREVKEMLQGMWKYYKYSCKALKELKDLAESMDEKAYKCTKADGSRWVPHLHRALEVLLCKNYKIIVLHFEHASQARDSSAEMQGRATNYSKKLKSFKFLKFMHLLLDVVKEVSKVSLLFQRDDVTVSAVQLKIDTLCGALDAMNLRPGEHVRSFCVEITDDNMFKETHLKRVNGDDASFMSIKSGLITSAKEYFHKRFSNFQEDPVLRGAADLSNPLLWPRERQDLLIFGENKLTDIIHHFQALLTRHNFDEQACLDEWLELKLLVYRRPQLREQSIQHFWCHVCTAFGNEFPNMLMVVELCLIIPVQTACVERGNSCLNRIMTDHRASLEVPTVSALMHIAINGPSHGEYDATRAVAHWLTSGEKRRRPEYMDQNRRDAE